MRLIKENRLPKDRQEIISKYKETICNTGQKSIACRLLACCSIDDIKFMDEDLLYDKLVALELCTDTKRKSTRVIYRQYIRHFQNFMREYE